MIILPEKDLHRLRQLRDDLEWLSKIVEDQLYRNKPWRHYGITIRSARMVVGSIISNVEWKMANEKDRSADYSRVDDGTARRTLVDG